MSVIRSNPVKIVYDIDGVVRDLMGIIHDRYQTPRPVNNWLWTHNGKTIFDLVREDYSVLVDAKPTKYCDVIQRLNDGCIVEFWSAQPDDWKKHTEKWLKKYFKKFIVKYFKHYEKLRTLSRNKDLILVEDYPMFKDYSRIVLIDWPYNQHVNPKIRIRSKSQLKEVINLLK
jgi:hypothetical protein